MRARYLLFFSENLQDKQAAFDELRKRTAVECAQCDGLGEMHYILFGKTNLSVDCHICNGEAELCAFCNGNSTQCECGE